MKFRWIFECACEGEQEIRTATKHHQLLSPKSDYFRRRSLHPSSSILYTTPVHNYPRTPSIMPKSRQEKPCTGPKADEPANYEGTPDRPERFYPASAFDDGRPVQRTSVLRERLFIELSSDESSSSSSSSGSSSSSSSSGGDSVFSRVSSASSQSSTSGRSTAGSSSSTVWPSSHGFLDPSDDGTWRNPPSSSPSSSRFGSSSSTSISRSSSTPSFRRKARYQGRNHRSIDHVGPSTSSTFGTSYTTASTTSIPEGTRNASTWTPPPRFHSQDHLNFVIGGMYHLFVFVLGALYYLLNLLLAIVLGTLIFLALLFHEYHP